MALVNTGEDWSLITEEGLTTGEKANLKSVNIVGQGVSKQALPNSGIVWRNLDNIVGISYRAAVCGGQGDDNCSDHWS